MKQTKIREFYSTSYQMLRKSVFLGGYLQKIRKQVEMIHPSEESTICAETGKTFFRAFLKGLVILWMLLLAGDYSIYYLCVCITVVLLLYHYMVVHSLEKMETKLIRQFEEFLGSVRHQYHESSMVDEAIYDSIEHAPYEIGLHAGTIYEVLTSSDLEESIARYQEIVPNRFFLTFVAICTTVLEYGDKIVEGQSLFLDNLNYLKQDLMAEILKREKSDYLFSGLTVLTAAPIFFLKLIERWALSNMPELQFYYSGTMGTLSLAVIFLSTILIFQIVNQLKSTIHQMEFSYFWLKRMYRKPFLFIWTNRILSYHYSRTRLIEERLKKTGSEMGVGIFFLKRCFLALLSAVVTLLVAVFSIKFSVLWILLILSMAALGYAIPYTFLWLRCLILQLSLEDEVVQFQSVILMLMHRDQAEIETILLWMERFAVVFKANIDQCINHFEGGAVKALEELRDRESFIPFRQLVDNMIASDRIGISKAFGEMKCERDYYKEKRKQDNEMILANKAAVGKVIAYIPMTMLFGLYLIIPFVIYGLRSLSGAMV